MKVSVSLPESDVEFLDEYVRSHGAASRSAAVQAALRLLREQLVGQAYQAAWEEWGDERTVWDTAAADGLDAPR